MHTRGIVMSILTAGGHVFCAHAGSARIVARMERSVIREWLLVNANEGSRGWSVVKTGDVVIANRVGTDGVPTLRCSRYSRMNSNREHGKGGTT